MAPSYTNPFANRKQIDDLEIRYLCVERLYPDQVALDAGKAIRKRDELQGSLAELRENLQKIFRWKLQSFLKRFKWVGAFPEGILDKRIDTAVAVAINALQAKDARKALQAFDDLPHVGIPVASAFLTALDPCQFTVIDRQAYKALDTKFPNNLRSDEYLCYVEFCNGQALNFGVSLRSYDRALWQYGSEISKSPKHQRLCNGDPRSRRAEFP